MEIQNDDSKPKFVVVVGASAGGMHSIIELCAQLSMDADVALLIVLHLAKVSIGSMVAARIQANTAFTCKLAEDGESIKSRFIYLGVPDKHLLIKDGVIRLSDGPLENMWRPSIDVLFRSAAAAYNSGTIGIILSGLLHDGTSGMLAIKRSGGTCIIQDPVEAEFADMPLSILNNMQVDYCVPLEQMGGILLEKSSNGIPPPHTVPVDVKIESDIAARLLMGLENMPSIGKSTPLICPDCGGGLWEMVNDNVLRFRCHTGHVFKENELLVRQSEELENTLYTALRMMEERKFLLDKMSKEEQSKGWKRNAEYKIERIKDLTTHIDNLKQILVMSKAS